ncbi:hypothetical protein BDQ17DRAFT_1342855 [Cyathus striatus]|nr:hypothetical protein BDQ17DRAFT_1342855 [Cyathus striatus]
MSSDVEMNPLAGEDSDDDFDWEEVEVPVHQPEFDVQLEEPKHIEITIQARPKPVTAPKQPRGISHAERLMRIDCHKIHTVALLANARIRNKWLNDELLQARLLSLTPMTLQNAFAVIHKSRVPNQANRGRMFENAMSNLAQWWATDFFEVTREGHIRNRTFDEVQRRMDLFTKNRNDSEDPFDIEILEDILDDEGELIRSEKSLMKHALMQTGSRDTSAQLFTALCRALGIPTRLVVSLQPVPWKQRKPKGKGKEKAENNTGTGTRERVGSDIKGKGKAKVFPGDGQRIDGAPIPKSDKAKGKEKAKPVIKLRKSKSSGQKLGSAPGSSRASSSRLASPHPVHSPPVFWTEVYSRADARWLPVDPIRGYVNNGNSNTPQTFGPTGLAHPYANANIPLVENRMLYVLAFEEDGFARDVTRRYARQYGATVAKLQGGSNAPNIGGGGKGRQAWWESVVNKVKRPYQLNRDDVEDAELEAAQMMEGMPTTIGGFKDHPVYVLVRHLKQTETIHPPPPETPELGKFRGEPVYPRSAVVSLKTAENWMRSEGRTVKPGCQALKFIKVRAGTVGRMRELEILKDGLKEAGSSPGPAGTSGGEVMQGLYSHPVLDGKVPKNSFGNIDLYVPSMLPKGGVHVPFKGAAKIARKLGFDYAEAVTGFEFKKRRAFPVIEGIVVAAENETVLLDAYWEAEREAEEKARARREDRVLKQWTRLIHGLQIRQRLQKQYGKKPEATPHEPKSEAQPQDEADNAEQEAPTEAPGGGFLVGADDVVQAFHLPKYNHVPLAAVTAPAVFEDTHGDQELLENTEEADYDTGYDPPDVTTYDLDVEMEEIGISTVTNGGVPKTMQELAEEMEKKRLEAEAEVEELELPKRPVISARSTPVKSGLNGRTTRSQKKKQPPRGRKRKARDSDKEEEAERSATESPEEVESEESKPVKRPRKKATAAPIPAPTRTLRPRTGKSAAQHAQEKEAEEAYRRAIAQ